MHIHTPLSIVQKYGGESQFEAFIDALEKLPPEVKVVGITDYYFIDGYERVIKAKLENGRLSNIEKVFPILEFRIDTFSSASRSNLAKVNLHILFDLDESQIDAEIENVRTQFLSKINISMQGKEKNLLLGKDAFTQLTGKLQNGFAGLPAKTDEVFGALEKPEWKTRTFLFLGYKEWSNLDFEEPLKEKKKELLSKVSAILTAGAIDDKKRADVAGLGLDTTPPILHSLDIHDFDKLDPEEYECNTWIKADPTFQGLKQIIYEPDDRVFIGDLPPVLGRVESDKTRYVDSLSIDHADDYNGHMGEWFKDISMEFNKELVVIIGNKGSGKSAIADILSLLGDTKQREFSFLNKDKFLANNNRLAANFCAHIGWESGNPSPTKHLSDNASTNHVESVRYIPQNYFEKLTNEIEIKEFRSELEKIIFAHIPDQRKSEQSDFAELRAYRTRSIDREIATLETSIQNANREIIVLEAQKRPESLEKIKSEIASKEREIAAQVKLLDAARTSTMPNKKQDSDITAATKRIERFRAQKGEIEKQLEKYQRESTALHLAGNEISHIKSDVLGLERDLIEFVESHKEQMAEQSLDIAKIIRWKFDIPSIDEKSNEIAEAGEKIKPILLSVDDIKNGQHPESAKKISLPWKTHKLEGELSDLQAKMTVEQRQLEQSQQRVRDIEAQINKLRGDENDPAPGTLRSHQKQKEFVEKSLDSALEDARNKRVQISLAIYRQKKEILDLYESFKKPVSALIENQEMLRGYNVNIESSFNMKSDFFHDFLRYIHKGKAGSFYGNAEGEQKIRQIVAGADLGQENGIASMLEEIIQHLEHDKREGQNNAARNISDQIEVKDLERFYEHVFSLRYLEPKYELKLGEKHLNELSPGERGVLLLVFYLMLDKENIPLILDQPEDNLDNQSVYELLSKFVRHAKKRRQIFIVTHNPNLAVGADAEQVICVSIDKEKANEFSFVSGSIESPEINAKIVEILEGTMPAFVKRRLKYQGRNDS